MAAVEAIQELCGNTTFWMNSYGVVPTRTGINGLSGVGIPVKPSESLRDDDQLVLQTKHTKNIGILMSLMCSQTLLGSDVDEEVLVHAVSGAAPVQSELAAAVLKPFVCDSPGQPCHQFVTDASR